MYVYDKQHHTAYQYKIAHKYKLLVAFALSISFGILLSLISQYPAWQTSKLLLIFLSTNLAAGCLAYFLRTQTDEQQEPAFDLSAFDFHDGF